MAKLLTSAIKAIPVDYNYISSPEVGFLRRIRPTFTRSSTKLIFRFLEASSTEPTTNQTYASLLKNLIFVKTFASGIFVPKNYILPVTADLYLEEFTSIVKDAHTAISTPFFKEYELLRNPAHKNDGKFFTLTDFLAFAAHNSSTGGIIIIENVPFFSEKLGIDVIGSVQKALNGSSILKSKVMIMSTNSSVLEVFKQQSTDYELVYKVDELISNVDSSTVQDIKTFASSVAVRKETIFPTSKAFITSQTKLVDTLHAANLSVYVYTLRNEFVSQPWDFFSDPIVETHNFFAGASSYKRNRCLTRNNYNIPLIPPRFLLSYMLPQAFPPALAPFPDLNPADVDESPLPSVVTRFPSAQAPAGRTPVTGKNDQLHMMPSLLATLVAMCFASLLLIL